MPGRQPQRTSSPVMQPRERILRIAILLGGKMIEERLIRERTSVTVGQSMKNTFSIPVDGLPLELTLFSLEEGKYHLRFIDKMKGKVGAGDKVDTLDSLRSGRGATNHGAYWSVPLSESTRGKLEISDLTILFQFVTAPPRQPRPMLPASVRGTFADRFDPRLSVILGASIIVHFAIVIVALTMDVPQDNGITERAYNLTFKPDEYKVDLEQPKPVETATQGTEQGSAAKQPEKPKTVPTIEKPKNDGGGRDEKADVARQEENAKAMADLLTGEGDNGKSEGDMSDRRPGAELGTQIAAVREGGKEVAVGGGAGRGPRGDGDPRVGTGKGPKIEGPGGTETAGGAKEEKAPTGRINVSDKQTFDDSSLTPDIVLSKIQSAYMAGLKRCYKEHLKKDASARGKVTLSLTVNETGRTTSGNAKGFASEVDDCISNQMSSWRFPVPKDKDGEATEASFAITLQLVPD
jgi:hypothetical protein